MAVKYPFTIKKGMSIMLYATKNKVALNALKKVLKINKPAIKALQKIKVKAVYIF